MKLLLIDDNPRLRALVRHHLSCDLTELDIVVHNPVQRGMLHPLFQAQAFSAVLIDHAWKAGSGLDWVKDLCARPGFAPVILLTPHANSENAAIARATGVFAVVGTAKIEHDELVAQVLAAQARQNARQADWRGSDSAVDAQTFNGAYVKGYRRLKKLASGSVSDIFLAESLLHGQLAVLKVTRDMRRDDGVDQTFERFLQEYEIVRTIRHPNVVRVLDLGVTDDFAYLVMEYFPKGDMRHLLRQGISPRRAIDYSLAIAGALQAIHAAGIQHRDLKPGNVLVRDDGTIALIDFGLAKHRSLVMEITGKGLIFGTPHYMSPEQGHGKPIDQRTDIYALGIMLYEMLTGKKPFDAENPMAVIYKHAKEPLPRLPEDLAALQPLLDSMLAKQPADRMASAAAAIEALQTVRQQLPEENLVA